MNDKYRLNAAIIPPNIGVSHSANYAIPKTTNIDMVFILGLLNSWLLNWLFKARSTNAHTTTSQIENASPYPTEQEPIIKLVQACMTAKAKDKNADISPLQRQIDELVYDLYGLTEDEIRTIEA